jgi:hypothetical protein
LARISINLSLTTEGAPSLVKTALTCLQNEIIPPEVDAGMGGSERDRCEELLDSSLLRIPKPNIQR